MSNGLKIDCFLVLIFSKNTHTQRKPVLESSIPVLGVKLKWEYRVFWLFFKIELCSAMSFWRSRREYSTDVAEREHRSMLKNYQSWLFFKIGLCSAISFTRSRRDYSIDVAEHRSMLEDYQNTYLLRFSVIGRDDKGGGKWNPQDKLEFQEINVCFLDDHGAH